jgi:hypothetical protein
MRLKSLSISRSWDGKEIVGEIEIEGESSETKLKLSEKQSQELIKVVAGTLVESAQALSKTLLSQTLELDVVKRIG